MKRRIVILICILALLLPASIVPAGGFAEGEHPITLSITVDPMPELEGEGTVPDMLFTIFNDSESDYTLYNAKLSGGYEDVERALDEKIEVLAGGKREFTLSDVPIAEDQLDVPVTYTLSWEEHEPAFDEETGEALIDDETGEAVTITHFRETSANIVIERFIVPELTVSAFCENELVRVGDSFTVEYTLKNDTLFDMTGLRLYDPEQGLQSIPLTSDELTAGRTMVVPVTYTMGVTDMTFRPTVEYVARRRNITTVAETAIGVGSVTVDLSISTQAFPATEAGTEFIITVKNNGNRTVTDIRVYDEINTLVDNPFDLPANQTKSIRYVVKPGVAADVIRTVRFHATGTDALLKPVTVTDPESFRVTPYIEQEGVRIELRVEPQKPYFDGNGKLCVAFQFRIGYYGDIRLKKAVLTETTLFHEVVSYPELLRGDTYFTQTYQIDGVGKLCFRVDAEDPAGQTHSSQTVTVDTTPFRDQVDRKTDPVYVVTTNPYMQDLDAKYRGILKLITVITLGVAAFCAIVCIVLYAFERKIRSKLPGEFEEDMEKALRATKRRPDDPLFNDTPTERFGYRQPIKLRSYGELTDEEAKARRELYARGLAEDMRREGARPAARSAAQDTSVRIDGDGTRVLSAAKPDSMRTADGTRIMLTAKPGTAAYVRPAEPVTPRPKSDTGEFRRPTAEASEFARPAARRTEPVTPRPKGNTGEFRRPTAEASESGRPAARSAEETATFRRPAEPVTPRPKGNTGEFRRPTAEAAAFERPAARPTEDAAFRRPAEPVTPRPKGNTGEFRRPTAEAPAFERPAARTSDETVVFRRPVEPVATKPESARFAEPRSSERPAVVRTVMPRPKTEHEPAKPAAPAAERTFVVRTVSESGLRKTVEPSSFKGSDSSHGSEASHTLRDGVSLLHYVNGFDEPTSTVIPASAAAISAIAGEAKHDRDPIPEVSFKEIMPESEIVPETLADSVAAIQPAADESTAVQTIVDESAAAQPAAKESAAIQPAADESDAVQPVAEDSIICDQPTEGEIPEPDESPTERENPEASFTTVTDGTTPQSAEADNSPDKGRSDVGEVAVRETDTSTDPSIQPPFDEGGVDEQPTEGKIPESDASTQPPSDEGGVGEQPTEGETSEQTEALTEGESHEPIEALTEEEPPDPVEALTEEEPPAESPTAEEHKAFPIEEVPISFPIPTFLLRGIRLDSTAERAAAEALEKQPEDSDAEQETLDNTETTSCDESSDGDATDQPPVEGCVIDDQPTEGETPESDASTQLPLDEGDVCDQPTEGEIPEPEESPTEMENPEASFTTVTVETTPQSAEADSSPDKGSSEVGEGAVVETDTSTVPSIQPPSDEGGAGDQPTEGEISEQIETLTESETTDPVESPKEDETTDPAESPKEDETPDPTPDSADLTQDGNPPEPPPDSLPEPAFLRGGPRRIEAQPVPAKRPAERQSIWRMNR